MIGFDRPIRPRWIYDTLLLAEPGQKLSELNKPFEGIANELTGKEGKRKARTVLFRCFLRDEDHSSRVKKNLILKDLSLKHGFDFMVPIYLFYLVGRTSVLYKISDHLFRLYGFGVTINKNFLKDKLVNLFGDRDVVARSVRSFLKTLVYFDVAQGTKIIYLKRPLKVDEEQISLMIKTFSKEIIRTPQIALNDLPKTIFNFFEIPELREVAQKMNGKYWEYQQRTGSDFLIVY